MKNSTFVGFTPNTGHRVCAGNENRFWKEFVSYNLAEIVQCREQDSGPDSYEYDAPEMRIDMYCPGWPETERERVDGEALRHGYSNLLSVQKYLRRSNVKYTNWCQRAWYTSKIKTGYIFIYET